MYGPDIWCNNMSTKNVQPFQGLYFTECDKGHENCAKFVFRFMNNGYNNESYKYIFIDLNHKDVHNVIVRLFMCYSVNFFMISSKFNITRI
jgi:hypothetical protein